MPTYEYRCKACGHHLEIVQAFTDDPLSTCPACESEALRKVFGSVGISFKGSGFYKNDSRGAATSSSGASGSSGSNGSSTSSDTASSTTSSESTSSTTKTADAKSA